MIGPRWCVFCRPPARRHFLRPARGHAGAPIERGQPKPVRAPVGARRNVQASAASPANTDRSLINQSNSGLIFGLAAERNRTERRGIIDRRSGRPSCCQLSPHRRAQVAADRERERECAMIVQLDHQLHDAATADDPNRPREARARRRRKNECDQSNLIISSHCCRRFAGRHSARNCAPGYVIDLSRQVKLRPPHRRRSRKPPKLTLRPPRRKRTGRGPLERGSRR